jgi:hypothetical protein
MPFSSFLLSHYDKIIMVKEGGTLALRSSERMNADEVCAAIKKQL